MGAAGRRMERWCMERGQVVGQTGEMARNMHGKQLRVGG